MLILHKPASAAVASRAKRNKRMMSCTLSSPSAGSKCTLSKCRRQAGMQFSFLLLVILSQHVQAQSTPGPSPATYVDWVSSGPALASSLARGSQNAVQVIYVTESITLTKDTWWPGGTVRILENRNVTIRGGSQTGNVSLNFGELAFAIVVESGSSLQFDKVDLLGLWPRARQPALPPNATLIPTFILWPSVSALPGAKVDYFDLTVVSTSVNCSTTRASSVNAERLELLFGKENVQRDSKGATRILGQQSIIVPVNDANENEVGKLTLRFRNLLVECADTGQQIAAGTKSSKGVSWWVWLLVGLGAALAVLGAAGTALLLRRRARDRRSSQRAGDKEKGFMDPPLEDKPVAAPHTAPPPPPSASKELERVSVVEGSSPKPPAAATALTGRGTRASEDQQRFGSRASEDQQRLGSRASEDQQQLMGMADLAYDFESSRLLPKLWQKTHAGGSNVLAEVEIGPLLGVGGYGRVYKARWKGAMIAAKVVELREQDGRLVGGLESLLSASVSHPNVVTTYQICHVNVEDDAEGWSDDDAASSVSGGGDPPGLDATTPRESARANGGGRGRQGGGLDSARDPEQVSVAVGDGAEGTPGARKGNAGKESGTTDNSNPPVARQAWLLLEFCDRGSLHDALPNRFTYTEDGPTPPTLLNIYRCLLDIASGLEYLHSAGIVHGDLKSANVLCKSTATDARGYFCKLADFGLSKVLDLHMKQSHVTTHTYGTLGYMPPEVLTHGRVTLAADMYSLGMLMWELYTGEGPFNGMSVGQVYFAVVDRQERPTVPPHCPADYRTTMEACWQTDAAARPNAAAVFKMLQSQYQALRGQAGPRCRPTPMRPAKGSTQL